MFQQGRPRAVRLISDGPAARPCLRVCRASASSPLCRHLLWSKWIPSLKQLLVGPNPSRSLLSLVPHYCLAFCEITHHSWLVDSLAVWAVARRLHPKGVGACWLLTAPFLKVRSSVFSANLCRDHWPTSQPASSHYWPVIYDSDHHKLTVHHEPPGTTIDHHQPITSVKPSNNIFRRWNSLSTTMDHYWVLLTTINYS